MTSSASDASTTGATVSISSSSAAAAAAAASAFDPETGTLGREFKNYHTEGTRGYGRTASLDDHPFLQPGITLICAPTGGGKTSAMLNILDEIFKTVNPRKLGRTMLFTGSPQDDMISKIDPEHVNIFGPERLEGLMDELRRMRREYEDLDEDKKPFTVLMLDDAGNNKVLFPDRLRGTEIGEVYTGHRHTRTHVIATAQRYKMFPPFMRENASNLLLFPGHSADEQKEIFRTLPLQMENLQRAYRQLDGRHDFVWVDKYRNVVKHKFSDVLLR